MKISQVNFNGKFLYGELKQKQAKKLREILTTKHNGVSSEQVLKNMPFDVDVVCLNPTKKAIHPRFNFWFNHSKGQATIQGKIMLNSKNPPEENTQKLNNFIIKFNNKLQSLKGDEKLSRAEETQRQVDFILFGRYK